jgi:hypothetical protein
MSLLTDIQNAALDPKTSVSDLLRRCQILAVRLRHEPFKAWVGHELNGYPDSTELPSYRGPFQGELKANIVGVQGLWKNVSVPASNIPAEVRAEVHALRFFDGVAELASMVEEATRAGEGYVGRRLPAELAAITPVWQGYNTIELSVVMSPTILSGILDQVRSKALEFALEIEAENPKAGDVAGPEPALPVARTNTIFQTAIWGGNVAVGPGAQVQVVQGDLASLMRFLESGGVEASDRRELEDAIEADGHRPGSCVRTWLGNLPFKAAASAGRIVEGAISAAVLHYFGLN